MKYFGSLGTFIVLMSTLLLLTKAWSSEVLPKQLLSAKLGSVEAIVTKVEQESLTLKPTSNNSAEAEISIPRTDDGTIQIGDRIVLQDEKIIKSGDGSTDSLSPDDQQSTGSESLSKTP